MKQLIVYLMLFIHHGFITVDGLISARLLYRTHLNSVYTKCSFACQINTKFALYYQKCQQSSLLTTQSMTTHKNSNLYSNNKFGQFSNNDNDNSLKSRIKRSNVKSYRTSTSVASSSPADGTNTIKHVSRFKLFFDDVKEMGLPWFQLNTQSQTDVSRQQRELKYRSYAAKKSSFKKSPTNVTINGALYTEDDFITDSKSQSKMVDGAYSTIWFRGAVVTIAYVFFPLFVNIIKYFTDDQNNGVVTGAVLPGLGILFGTLISLTYSILFTRQATLQNIATEESSTLATLTHHVDTLYGDDYVRKHIAFSYIWDHAETLIERSRLQELLQITNNQDPLIGLMKCLNEITSSKFLSSNALYADREYEILDVLLPISRSTLSDLLKLRSGRLNQESLTLPPIHFWILILLSVYQLLGYAIVVASDFKPGLPFPSLESRLLFSLLTGVFAFSINFAADLNQPFNGVYQVRRSSTSAFLIQVYETIRQDIAKDKVRRQQIENAMDIPVTDSPSAGASVTAIDVDTILTGESSDEWSSADSGTNERSTTTTATVSSERSNIKSNWVSKASGNGNGGTITAAASTGGGGGITKPTTTRQQQQQQAVESESSDNGRSNQSKMSINKLTNSASTRTHSAATTSVSSTTMTRATVKQESSSSSVHVNTDDDIDIFNPFTVAKSSSPDDDN